MSDKNQRKFPRADYPCYLTLWLNNKFNTIQSKTVNVGAGGLLVNLNQSLMIGAKVEIKVDFSLDTSFECTGLVLRCQENRQNAEDIKNPYAVAIVFENLDETKVAYLKNLVEKLLTHESNS